jgi:hypothetical protein
VRPFLIPALAFAVCIAMLFVPPIHQDAAYHNFADQRTILGVPNFWNVVSNLPFLAVAVWGWRRVNGFAYRIFLIGVAAVTFGSAYYHAWPSNATLFWDRLPMTIGFMALFAGIIEERLDKRAGRLLLWPLVIAGVASAVWWHYTDDLRWYVVVQFFPPLAMLLLLRGRRDPLIPMMLFYALAKILEWQDQAIAAVISTGGHPWKHVAAAAAVFFYVRALEGQATVKRWPAPHGNQNVNLAAS